MKYKHLLFIFGILFSHLVTAQNEFITTWKPSNVQTQQPTNVTFPSAGNQVWAPFVGNNFSIYWEEKDYPAHHATLSNVTSTLNTLLDFGTAHNPNPNQATYIVKVSNGNGNFHRIAFSQSTTTVNNLTGDNAKIIEINQWGNTLWSSMQNAFSGCKNMNLTATDTPNLSVATDMSFMFSGCTSLIGNTSFNNWNISNITSLTATFSDCTLFNQPIGNWDTGNVTNMEVMFKMCYNFNQPIGNWNTSKVTAMTSMFFLARKFNQPIGNWDVGQVTDMEVMFSNAWDFNQNIQNWNTSEVLEMNNMFQGAKVFNQPIGSWNTSKVTTMQGMFNGALNFNQPIGNWDTSAVLSMSSMFLGATSFNQNIGTWNMSNVTAIDNMFFNATNFNQNLGTWSLNSLISAYSMFLNSGLNCQNYDSTLYGWSLNPATPSNINLVDASPLIYTHPAAVVARNYLINTKGWTITGDSYDDKCSSALSTQEIHLNSTGLQIYPNPATDFIYVKNLKGSHSYKIFDQAGRLILKGDALKEKIDIQTLPKGNYILQIKSKELNKNFKITKK